MAGIQFPAFHRRPKPLEARVGRYGEDLTRGHDGRL
jgi:hypothetical protein